MANLILNPDFTNWPLFVIPPNDWTYGRYNNQLVAATTPVVSPPLAVGFNGGSNYSMQQSSIPTTDGVTYTLSFFLTSNVSNVNTMNVDVNGSSLPIIVDTAPNIYKQYSIQFIAPFGTTTVEFYTESNTNLVLLDNVSLTEGAICYRGTSKVFSKNILTGEIDNVAVKDITASEYAVYSSKSLTFIPLKYNIVTGPYNRFVKIKKNLFGENKPSEDLYITSGHRIVYDGKEIKARDVPGSEIVKIKPESLYSLCVEQNQPIIINNIEVIAYGVDEWLEYAKKKNIMWHNN